MAGGGAELVVDGGLDPVHVVPHRAGRAVTHSSQDAHDLDLVPPVGEPGEAHLFVAAPQRDGGRSPAVGVGERRGGIRHRGAAPGFPGRGVQPAHAPQEPVVGGQRRAPQRVLGAEVDAARTFPHLLAHDGVAAVRGVDAVEAEEVAADLCVEAEAGGLLILVGELAPHLVDGQAARLTPGQVAQHPVHDGEPLAVEGRARARVAVVGQVVVERVQGDVGPGDLRHEGGENFLQVLPRVDQLGDRALDLHRSGRGRRIHVLHVVADDGERDQVGLALDLAEHVVAVGFSVVDQQVVGVLPQHGVLVQRDRRRGCGAQKPFADAPRVPEALGERAEVEIGRDAVAHGRIAEAPRLEVPDPQVELGEACAPHGVRVARGPLDVGLAAGVGEAPARRVRGQHQIAAVPGRGREVPRRSRGHELIEAPARVAGPEHFHLHPGQRRLGGIADAVPVPILEGGSGDLGRRGRTGE